MNEKLNSVLADVVGGGHALKSFWERIEACELLLEAAKLPKASESLVFKYACASPVLRDKSIGLYRAHVAELIERVRVTPTEKALLPGTKAECLAALMGLALKAPLNHGATALAASLFRTLFPAQAQAMFHDWNPVAVHPGQLEEDLAVLRTKLTREKL